MEQAVEEKVIKTKKDAALWMKARDLCEKNLGYPPSNADMVHFAKSREGKFVRHFFPFNDLRKSAWNHWVELAGHYTRRAKIIFTSDPSKAPHEVRALHVVTVEHQGKPSTKGIVTTAQLSNNKKWGDEVLADALRSLKEFTHKYEDMNKILNSPKLAKAVALAIQAMEELADE